MADLPKIKFAPQSSSEDASTLIYFLAEKQQFGEALKELDGKTGGSLSRAVEVASFKAKRKSAIEVLAPHGVAAGRVILLGLGAAKSLTERDWVEIGGAARGKLSGKPTAVSVVFDETASGVANAALSFALGFTLRSYSFRKYKSKKKAASEAEEGDVNDDSDANPSLTILTSASDELSAAWSKLGAAAEAIYFARDLVNEPANVLTPPEFAARLKALEADGLAVEVMDQEKLKALGMNALLAVGQGSAQPTFAVVLRWNGNPDPHAGSDGNTVFIGKGVCFDTGGISIKPAPGMEEMKGDMAGAAAVAGVMKSLAKQNAPVNAVGIVGLVENMPSGTAFRPGDVITAASGQTIEVQNTDAEGRMVLADLIWYAQKHLDAKRMVTLATLTGAIIVALGKENAGLFSNDDRLAEELTTAGLDTGETVWRLPLSKKYDKMIDSKIADMKNIGGRDAGSITAAQFLGRFVNDGIAWAHLDIAGTGMSAPSTDINHSWGSGFGVRLLERLLIKPV